MGFTGQVELTLTLTKIKALVELSAMKIGAFEFRRAKDSLLGPKLDLTVLFFLTFSNPLSSVMFVVRFE
jgi:hypothetical protein